VPPAAIMPDVPQISTAVPKRRYKIGEFVAVVLGDIVSRDGIDYRYVFALVREGEPEPRLYVALERVTGGAVLHQMRVTVGNESRAYEAEPAIADIENFSQSAIAAAVQLFNLEDEEVYRLL